MAARDADPGNRRKSPVSTRLRRESVPPSLKATADPPKRWRRWADRRSAPLAVAFVGIATACVFWRATGFPFLNWDDQDIFVRNAALHAPGVFTWAFTTRYIEHYQPLAWTVWAGLESVAGLTPSTAHALNIVLHAACAVLVYELCLRVAAESRRHLEAGPPDGRDMVVSIVASAAAALIWAVHPLRVEPVVWASAMPYPLALAFALAAALAWIAGRPWTAGATYVLSLLARPLAFLLPIVLWFARRPTRRSDRIAMMLMVLASVSAVALESSARLSASLDQFSVGARLTLAAAAPWRYLFRTLWPVGLTPVDPLALTPRTQPFVIVCGIAGVVLVSLAAWRWRRQVPVLAVAWVAYLALLAPAMGLVPSGLQATADRYTYMPAIAIAVAMVDLLLRIASTIRRARTVRATSLVIGLSSALVIVVLAVLTWHQATYWSDSIVLWTRAVTLDPRNDVALYNLGSALAERGKRDEAIARYEAVLQLVPNNEAARRNRDLLQSERLEEEANSLASGRNLDGAIERYAEAVRLDPNRTHSQAALGVALTERGRYEEARPHLQRAIEQGATDAAVPNALAFVLVQTGHPDAAVVVLREALTKHPEDVNLRRNLEGLVRGRRAKGGGQREEG